MDLSLGLKISSPLDIRAQNNKAYRQWLEHVFHHEVCHIVGFHDIDADRFGLLMGKKDLNGTYRGAATTLTCSEWTGLKVMYGQP